MLRRTYKVIFWTWNCSMVLISIQRTIWSWLVRDFERESQQKCLGAGTVLVSGGYFPQTEGGFDSFCVFWFILKILALVLWTLNDAVVFQMAISPSRMPQPPSMMGAHANNLMAQAPAQNQFLAQNQFPSSSGAMSVNSVGMGQPVAQTGVSQVPFTCGPLCCLHWYTPASYWPEHVLLHGN